VHVCRTLKNLKTLQSPVFLSTGEDGRVQEGCGGIPLDRPLLLVSNHQTFALDIGPLVEGLLRQTGLLPRGLTHPAVFQVCFPSSFSPFTPSPPHCLPVYCLHSRPVQYRRSFLLFCRMHSAVATGLHKCFAPQDHYPNSVH